MWRLWSCIKIKAYAQLQQSFWDKRQEKYTSIRQQIEEIISNAILTKAHSPYQSINERKLNFIKTHAFNDFSIKLTIKSNLMAKLSFQTLGIFVERL